MTGAELADELSSIGDAYCSDARVAWQLARFVNANMAAILAALRSERPAVDVQGAAEVGAVERAGYALYLADPRAVVYKSWAQLSDKLKEHYGSRARAALAAAQEG